MIEGFTKRWEKLVQAYTLVCWSSSEEELEEEHYLIWGCDHAIHT